MIPTGGALRGACWGLTFYEGNAARKRERERVKCVEYKYKYVQYVYKIKLKGVGIQSTPLFGRAVFHAGGGSQDKWGKE